MAEGNEINSISTEIINTCVHFSMIFIHGCNHDKKLRIKQMLVFLSLLAFMQSYTYLIYLRYFAQNSTGSCERCHKSCKECMGPRATDCLSCNTYFYLLHSTNECVSSCPQYYYENKDNNVCERCHSSCLTCDGKSLCSALSKKKGSPKHLESQLHDLGTLHKDTNHIQCYQSVHDSGCPSPTVGDVDLSQGLLSFSCLLVTCCTHVSLIYFYCIDN